MCIMDNLILKTVNFLFVPEAALAVVFLIVFIILCIYGYLKVKKCKLFITELEQNMEAEFDKCKDKYNPHTFISGKLAAISGIENEVMQIPNIFVSIGILATFLGLGVAIQSAAALLKSNTVELAKLNDVLGIIAFKFQTSVWGIMFSLLFQKIIVNTYFEFKENIVSAMHEKLYEKVKAGIHKTLDEQNGLLEQQIELQKETQQLNQNNMDSLQNLTKEHNNAYIDYSNNFSDKGIWKDHCKKVFYSMVLVLGNDIPKLAQKLNIDEACAKDIIKDMSAISDAERTNDNEEKVKILSKRLEEKFANGLVMKPQKANNSLDQYYALDIYETNVHSFINRTPLANEFKEFYKPELEKISEDTRDAKRAEQYDTESREQDIIRMMHTL